MATQNKDNVDDIETGKINGQLYPDMQENPQIRRAFILKVYSILCFQFLLTFGVGLAMPTIHPVREFMGTSAGFWVLIATVAVTFTTLKLMVITSERHPWNYILLLLFTLALSFLVGAAACNPIKGELVLLAAGLTLLVTVGLTLFTFVAAKGDWDFGFLGPFMFCALLLDLAIGVVRICFPMVKIEYQVFSSIEALVFCGFIIYITDDLIKQFNYDQHTEALISLFSRLSQPFHLSWWVGEIERLFESLFIMIFEFEVTQPLSQPLTSSHQPSEVA